MAYSLVFITINYFLLSAIVNVLTISRAGLMIAAWIDKCAVAVSITESILQHMMDSITGWILQQCSWML